MNGILQKTKKVQNVLFQIVKKKYGGNVNIRVMSGTQIIFI